MDFDDLENLNKRLTVSLEDFSDSNVQESMNITSKPIEGGQTLTWSFGNKSPIEIQNKIMEFCNLVYNYKDNLKNKFKEKNIDPVIIKNFIKNSTYIKVAIDISNMGKHGSNLDDRQCSFIPKIKNLCQALSVTGSTIIGVNGPNSSVVICGQIEDENGKLIFQITDLVQGAFDELNVFLKQNNLVSL